MQAGRGVGGGRGNMARIAIRYVLRCVCMRRAAGGTKTTEKKKKGKKGKSARSCIVWKRYMLQWCGAFQ